MGEIGSIAYLLIFFNALIIVGAILTPFVQQVLENYSRRIATAGDKERIRKIMEVEQLLNQPDHRPDEYRDPELDELIQAGRLDEAGALAAERLRLACERGLDERMEFYREYERRIEAAKRGE
jgi:hypothetical protein